MDTKIYNIDSRNRNTTNFPNSNDFIYNKVDELRGTTYVVEPFNEKNVIEMKISSLEIPDTVSTLSATENYFLVQINNFGNIINKNINYVAKVIYNSNQDGTINLLSNNIKFDQPTDIANLRISLVYNSGSLVNLSTHDYSFSLEIVVINNSILKNYNEIKFYNDTVMQRILNAKMLAYYEKQVDDNTMTGTYNMDLIKLNTQQEYTVDGNKNNYAPSFSYFTDMK